MAFLHAAHRQAAERHAPRARGAAGACAPFGRVPHSALARRCFPAGRTARRYSTSPPGAVFRHGRGRRRETRGDAPARASLRRLAPARARRAARAPARTGCRGGGTCPAARARGCGRARSLVLARHAPAALAHLRRAPDACSSLRLRSAHGGAAAAHAAHRAVPALSHRPCDEGSEPDAMAAHGGAHRGVRRAAARAADAQAVRTCRGAARGGHAPQRCLFPGGAACPAARLRLRVRARAHHDALHRHRRREHRPAPALRADRVRDGVLPPPHHAGVLPATAAGGHGIPQRHDGPDGGGIAAPVARARPR